MSSSRRHQKRRFNKAFERDRHLLEGMLCRASMPSIDPNPPDRSFFSISADVELQLSQLEFGVLEQMTYEQTRIPTWAP